MIPFVRDFDFAYGRPDQVSPLIRRVIAPNPGPLTFTGTGTYLIGRGEVAVIDPGPSEAAAPTHLPALLEALRGERVVGILVTHSHLDHSPLAARLQDATGAPILGRAARVAHLPLTSTEEGDPLAFAPDRELSDGQRLSGPGWTLRAMATPGHASNHLCFVLEEENALLCGDHVMGWSTTVVNPPDGDMGDYLSSLDRVVEGRFATLWPAHGPPVTDAAPFLRAYREHRREREAQILAVLREGPTRIEALVQTLYAGLDARLRPAAARSVWAHLIHLHRTGRVDVEGAATLDAAYRISNGG